MTVLSHRKANHPALAVHHRLLPSVIVAAFLSGCAGQAGLVEKARAVGESVGRAVDGSSQQGAGNQQALQADSPTPTPLATSTAGKPLSNRQGSSLQALFDKGTVTGAELVPELAAVRALMKDKRSATAIGQLLGPQAQSDPKKPVPAAQSIDFGAEARKVVLKQFEEAVKPYIASIGFGAFELHMRTMLEDPKMLASESIKLPSSKGMTQAQMQRVVNMAAILAATRVTGRILKKAQEDFANIENEYTKLITRREKAAELLFGVLTQNAGSGALSATYDNADLNYLRGNVSRMSIKEFSSDLGAQNLALRYLRQTNPKEWEDYKLMSDGLRSSTKGYIRSAAGVTAFAALLANFFNETVGAINKHKGLDILDALPLALEFGKEVPPLLREAWRVGAAGVVELPMKANKRFRIVDARGSTDVAQVADVFAAMKSKGADTYFNESIFRSGTDGLLYKLYRCDKSEVGRMLDVSLPMPDREKFGAIVFPDKAERFSFANAFNDPDANAKAKEFGDDMLSKDHRSSSSAVHGVAMGEAQRAATRGAERWNNDQLLRLILANREGVAAHATLQLGEFIVRPVPTMQSVFAYESLIDECAAQFGAGSRAAGGASQPPVAVPANDTKPTSATKPATAGTKVPKNNQKPATSQPTK